MVLNSIYDDIEKWLEPAQWLVYTLCLVIIFMTVFVMVHHDDVARTAWVVYMFMP